jgi:hypothetical protein
MKEGRIVKRETKCGRECQIPLLHPSVFLSVQLLLVLPIRHLQPPPPLPSLSILLAVAGLENGTSNGGGRREYE